LLPVTAIAAPPDIPSIIRTRAGPHHICSSWATAIPVCSQAEDFSGEQIPLNFVLSNG
jgi:hypothetical protein